jgi:hypothetical protein
MIYLFVGYYFWYETFTAPASRVSDAPTLVKRMVVISVVRDFHPPTEWVAATSSLERVPLIIQ